MLLTPTSERGTGDSRTADCLQALGFRVALQESIRLYSIYIYCFRC